MIFELGKNYFGCSSEDGLCSNEQRFVVEAPDESATDTGVVYFQTPHGLGQTFKVSEAEFETWCSRSERRTYVDADGVRKTRLGFVVIEPGKAPEPLPASEVRTIVQSHTGDAAVDPIILVEVSDVGSNVLETPDLAKWLEWRDTAK